MKTMLSALLYASATIVTLYIILVITWRIWTRRYSFLPSAPNIPWLGMIPYMGSSSRVYYNTVVSICAKYDHPYVSWFGPIPQINIGCVEWIEPLLKNQDIIIKTWQYDFLYEWIGRCLALATGKKWKKRRTTLNEGFHFTNFGNYIEVYEKQTKSLGKRVGRFSINDEAIEVQFPIKSATLNIIDEITMGVKINALESYEADYMRAVHKVKNQIMRRNYNPLLWSDLVYQFTSSGKAFDQNLHILNNFDFDVINKNIASRNDARKHEEINNEDITHPHMVRKKIFLDILLDLYDKGEIDVEGIREEVETFMFVGYDTTSSALSWTLYEIGRHDDIQEKIHEEIDGISSMQCSTMDKIRQLKYLENVIKESLRFHPPVIGFTRLLEKDTIFGENVVPSGTEMCVSILSVHMNHKYWDEPNVFKPDRFENEDFLKKNPYCYIPFSVGLRNCIGQKFAMLELKMFIYFVLSNVHIKSTQAPDEIEICADIITYSANGISIQFSSEKS